MKEIVFILLVSFGQQTVKVDTNYATVIRAANPKVSNYIEAVVFYDKQYFITFLKTWKCSSCEVIDIKNRQLFTMHSKK